jgi:uncharacterized alkaline shock family protein YloU/adenylate kinase family enzyme
MIRLFRHINWLFKGVRVFALVGRSGTGKSFRARLLSQKYGIELLIDDGLLIRDQKILAGRSSKKEKAYMAAVKTALFHDKEHRHEVAECIKRQRFRRILIIGTSEGMVHKIAQTLELPSPAKIIQIEDIATQEEIDTALHFRNVQGKHVIPVPSIEVRRSYPKIMGDSITIFLKKRLGMINKDQIIEKTVVRPDFSKKGTITISEAAMTQMVLHCIQEFEPLVKLKKITINNSANGYRIDLAISVPYGIELTEAIYDMQKYISDNVERFTGILIEELNITIDSLN